jgi:4-hydroxy-tetrahydrodipicolinate synthase
MVLSFLEGNIDKAKKLQVEAIELISSLFCEVNPIPVKAALNLMGFNAGGYREPLIEMDDKNLERLKKAMKEYGIL